ncbi:MAG: hypothetical protein IH627_12495 [Rubrivivax sp.]|nr:hypothetical protein [Rubrivivax sp.]
MSRPFHRFAVRAALAALLCNPAWAQTALPKATPAEQATLQKFVHACMSGLEDKDFDEVLAQEVALRIEGGKKDFVVIDVRIPKDKKYDLGHVPGAIHVKLLDVAKAETLARLPWRQGDHRPRAVRSVALELEWVMRGYYSFARAEVASVLRHLLDQTHITIEDRDAVEQALASCEAGTDFADALHHASYKSCASVATFDDRQCARRTKKLGLAPAVMVVSYRSAFDG